MAERRIGRKALGLGLAVLVLGALSMPAAHAAASVGVSAACNTAQTHCVEGGATAANAGVHSTVDEIGDVGVAVAVCHGLANGASLIEITCSHGQVSQQMSFPGTAGAVPLQTTEARLERLPVCWEVTAYFPTVTGPPQMLTTTGCSQLSL